MGRQEGEYKVIWEDRKVSTGLFWKTGRWVQGSLGRQEGGYRVLWEDRKVSFVFNTSRCESLKGFKSAIE